MQPRWQRQEQACPPCGQTRRRSSRPSMIAGFCGFRSSSGLASAGTFLCPTSRRGGWGRSHVPRLARRRSPAATRSTHPASLRWWSSPAPLPSGLPPRRRAPRASPLPLWISGSGRRRSPAGSSGSRTSATGTASRSTGFTFAASLGSNARARSPQPRRRTAPPRSRRRGPRSRRALAAAAADGARRVRLPAAVILCPPWRHRLRPGRG